MFILEIAAIVAIVLMIAVVGWIFGNILKDSSLADVYWGIYFIFIALGLFFQSFVHNKLQYIALILIIIWGLRIAGHIALRKVGKPEDYRYQKWRVEWRGKFWWKNLLQNYLFQAFLALIISSSIIVIFYDQISNVTIHWWQYIAIGVWVFGFIFEVVSDHQLSQFQKKRINKEAILNQGLWKYSRHPNYFGEITQWWALWILTIGLSYFYIALLSPLLITFLIVYVSGIPMLEKRYHDNKNYAKYKKTTPILIPFIKSRTN